MINEAFAYNNLDLSCGKRYMMCLHYNLKIQGSNTLKLGIVSHYHSNDPVL